MTLTYRVGIFGSLALDKLKEKDPHHATGNQGLLDTVMAMQWIKDNIRQFGGDPDCSTVFGQSGGGMRCKFLLTSPLTRGMVKRTIMMSVGGIWDVDVSYPLDTQIGMCEDLLGRAGWTFDDLMSREPEEIYTVLETTGRKIGLPPLSLSGNIVRAPTENYTTTDYAGAVFNRGLADDVEIMTGSILEECHNFPFQVLGGIGEWKREFALGATLSLPERYIDLYKTKPIHHYFFERSLPGDNRPMNHCDELPYIYGSLDRFDRDWEEKDRELSELCMQYWISFAKTGNPNGDGLPEWPAFTAEHPVSMRFTDHYSRAEDLASDQRVQKVVRFLIDHPGNIENKARFFEQKTVEQQLGWRISPATWTRTRLT